MTGRLMRLAAALTRPRPAHAITAVARATPLDRRQGTWLLAVAALTVAPHGLWLPGWIHALCLLLLAWRGALLWQGTRPPPALLLLALSAAAAARVQRWLSVAAGPLAFGPAAARYTECRLNPLAMQLLADIDEDTVDMIPNYDGSTEQPLVLRVLSVLVGLGAGVAVASISEPGRRFIGFARESITETKKVVWPSRKEATQTTGLVFAFVIVMAIFLWLTDKSLEWVLYDLVLGWK